MEQVKRRSLGKFASVVTLAILLVLTAAETSSALNAHDRDIGVCPGLIGQPQARQDLLSEYICVPSLAQPSGTPSQLNRACFLRIHRRPPNGRRVDAVIIYGAIFGGTIDTELPAEIVDMAALQGKNIEVWAVVHRENNLQDTAGLGAAWLAKDPAVALSYYFGDNYLGPDGRFAGVLGGPGARFVPLQQTDVPFMADWGADVQYRDVETILDLIPRKQRSTNVFLMSASPNSEFNTQFAGFKLLDGHRGYQELAGIIVIEGSITSLGASTEPTVSQVNDYIASVEAIRNGTAPRYDTSSAPAGGNPTGTSGVAGRIASQIIAMASLWQPTEESIFLPLPAGASGGPLADQFNADLHLTNHARDAFGNSADPIPGTFLQAPGQTRLGGREGYLDFAPEPGSPACAAPGPFGLTPPCVPAVSQIDPNQVYDWLDGGFGGPGATGNPLSGWTETAPGVFTDALVNGGDNPSNITLNRSGTFPGTRTNNSPVAITFPTSGKLVIDSSFKTTFQWYLNNRFENVDVPFINSFQKVLINRDDVNIHLDFDKTGVSIPVIEYVVHLGTQNLWPNVHDFTVVDPAGVSQSELAAARSPINPAINFRLYNNIDIHTADNSQGPLTLTGQVTPGDLGANPIPDTLVSWITARAGKSGVLVPKFKTHLTCSPLQSGGN